MNCPNCSHELLGNVVCPKCGVDTVLFSRTTKISNDLYNEGLEQAKQSDLFSAVVSLTKSIEFNKNNINARNVLGLVFYEMGRIGDALKHFVISSSIQKESNPANDYIEAFQKNSRLMERQNEAIKMYNQALQYLKQKSDDIAIIQLKKALEINSRYIDAMNLLSLCYFIQNEKDKVRVLAEKVLAIDVNNPIALNYFKEVSPGKMRPEANVVKVVKPTTTPSPQTKPVQQVSYGSYKGKEKNGFGNHFYISEIIFFIIGAGCAFALLYMLVIPSEQAKKDTEISTLKATIATQEQTLSKKVGDNAKAIVDLEETNKNLEKQNGELLEQVDILERTGKIFNVANLFASGNAEEAADALSSLNVAKLPADVLDKAKLLKDEVYPAASLKLYNDGVKAYNNKEYDKAKLLLEKCMKFTDPIVNHADDVIYYLGLIAEVNGDVVNAKKYFNTVIDEYSNSNQYYRAKNKLANLK